MKPTGARSLYRGSCGSLAMWILSCLEEERKEFMGEQNEYSNQ